METIGRNESYVVEIDKLKNRLYLTGKGFWKDPAVASDFLATVKRAAKKLAPGYTALVDLHEFKTPPQGVAQGIIALQKALSAAGIRKSAEVVEKNLAIAMPMDRYSKSSGITRRVFDNQKAAEAWLDAA